MRGFMIDQQYLIPAGHDWVWVNRGSHDFDGPVGVNWPVLLTLWSGVLAIAGLLFYSFRDELSQ